MSLNFSKIKYLCNKTIVNLSFVRFMTKSRPLFFHSTGKSCEKLLVWQGAENSFFYKVIKKVNESKKIVPVSSPLCQSLERILQKTDSPEANELLDQLSGSFRQCTNVELLGVFNVLENYHESELFTKAFDLVDKEGTFRVSSSEPAFVIAGALRTYELNVFPKSKWAWNALRRFMRRLNRLSKEEMLTVMFLANINRKFPQLYSGFDVQYYLVDHFDHLSLEEMAVVSLAFFKCEVKMNNKVIMSKIMRKLHDEVPNCDGIALAMLSKIIRYSLPITLGDELYATLNEVAEQVPNLSLPSLTHLALTGSNILLNNESLTRSICKRLTGEITNLRLKDMERMLLVMSLFNIRDDDFIDAVMKELPNREKEIDSFPKPLLSLISYLTVLEKFDYYWIDKVLSGEFIKHTYELKVRKVGCELITIDTSVGIECPDYKGNRLSESYVCKSAKIVAFSERQPDGPTSTKKFSYEIEGVLKEIYGLEAPHYCFLLPHYFLGDFVLGFNEDLKAIAPPKTFKVSTWGTVKHVPDNRNTWLAILVGGWNTLIRNDGRPLGTMVAKMRQLRILGYHPLLIPYNEWRRTNDKKDYVKNLVEPELQRVSQLKAVSKSI